MKFIFNLEVLTKEKIFSVISDHFNISETADKLSSEMLSGKISSVDYLVKKMYLLKNYSVNRISDLTEKISLNTDIVNFTALHDKDVLVVSDNFRCWIDKLIKKVNCNSMCSEVEVVDDKVSSSILHFLRKEDIVREYRMSGEKVCFIGNTVDDIEAMRLSDISITSAISYDSDKRVSLISDYYVASECALCRQLNQLL